MKTRSHRNNKKTIHTHTHTHTQRESERDKHTHTHTHIYNMDLRFLSLLSCDEIKYSVFAFVWICHIPP